MSDAYEGRDKLKDVHTTPAATRLALKLVKQQLGPLCEVGGRGGGRRDCARGGGAAAGGDDAACTAAAAPTSWVGCVHHACAHGAAAAGVAGGRVHRLGSVAHKPPRS